MFNKGDTVKFIDCKDWTRKTEHTSTNYKYDTGLSERHGSTVAKSLVLSKVDGVPLNEGIVIFVGNDNYTLVEYTDINGYVGSLYFSNEVLELLEKKSEIINNYSIF